MARPLWDEDTAMLWLEQQRRNPDKNYKNLCLHLFARSGGYDYAGQNDASTWGRSIPESIRIPLGKCGRGDALGWVTNGWGHVARVAGWVDGVLYVLCNLSDGRVGLVRADYYAGLGRPFAVDGNASRAFKYAGGTNPGRKPVKPAPVKKPPAVVAPAPAGYPGRPIKPGESGQYIVTLKTAAKFSNKSPKYGGAFKRWVVKLQRKHNLGTPDGVIGPKTWAAIVAGKRP